MVSAYTTLKTDAFMWDSSRFQEQGEMVVRLQNKLAQCHVGTEKISWLDLQSLSLSPSLSEI